ncbi:MAG: UDP-N-acetylmuramate dehydrogenase [Myxococcota bacterium]|nr:UDP-N-acetylmuramate dehydrogenase [Myxococcota bacterium]
MLQALQETGAKVRENADLNRKLYWRCGGPARFLVEASSLEQLQAVMRVAHAHQQPVTVLGRGSNSLVHDDGISGITLMLKGALAAVEIEGERAVVGGGLRLNVLLSRLDRAGLAGAEPFAGIPGTMGGAVVMNAGTTLGEAKDLLVSAEIVLPDGSLQVLEVGQLGLSYRHSALPPGSVVARATLQLQSDSEGTRAAAREAFLERRKATQPLDLPSCGSTFTNPPGDSAGRLIDACGLKGHRIGGAVISEKHANFFLNEGGASSEDVRQLIVHARRVVFEQTGVLLRPEVQLLGDWGPDPLGI